MEIISGTAALLLGVIVWALLSAGASLVSDEIRGWLELVPGKILRMAAMRLDPTIRLTVYRHEWLPDLLYITRQAEGRPITRLLKATSFALGHLRSARRQARYLRRVPQQQLARAHFAAKRGQRVVLSPSDNWLTINTVYGMLPAREVRQLKRAGFDERSIERLRRSIEEDG